MRRFLVLLVIVSATLATKLVDGSLPPKPTPDVLAWTKQELGAFFSFNIVTEIYPVLNTQEFCINVGGTAEYLPPASFFYPELIDLDNWLETAVAFGAKYAILTAQHCSGFSMWPTDVAKATGFDYEYSTRNSPLRGGGYDVVAAFINSCKKYNVAPGIYYSLNQNFYLNVASGKVQSNSSLLPGQVSVSQEMYNKIVLAQMRELWGNYGQLSELWFDGGCIPGLESEIADLTSELQPNAVYFGGCSKTNNLRWVGTESGTPPYPIWSTAMTTSQGSCIAGQGSANGSIFCPAETDTTLQLFDKWFYREGNGYRNLTDLQAVYMKSVGQNTNLLLNVAANRSGLVPTAATSIYQAFGDWIKSCFGSPVAKAKGMGTYLTLKLPQPTNITKVVVMEDQREGEMVTGFAITAQTDKGEKLQLMTDGRSIGNKYILDLIYPLLVTTVELNITKAYHQPTISDFSVYECSK